MKEGQMPTPEEMAKIQKERELYEKDAKKTASKLNTTWENVTGKGLTKETVIASDAQYENELRRVGAVGMLRELSNSALKLTPKIESAGNYTRRYTIILDGVIGDSNVRLLVTDVPSRSWRHEDDKNEEKYIRRAIGNALFGGQGTEYIEGEINGTEISKELAKKIWMQYYHVAVGRTDELLETKKELRIDK